MSGRSRTLVALSARAALLWNDSGVLRFFGGGVGLPNVLFRLRRGRTRPAAPLTATYEFKDQFIKSKK